MWALASASPLSRSRARRKMAASGFSLPASPGDDGGGEVGLEAEPLDLGPLNLSRPVGDDAERVVPVEGV